MNIKTDRTGHINERPFLGIWMTLFIIACLFVSCEDIKKEDDKIYLAISKGAPADTYGNYSKWLRQTDSSVVYIDMYHMSFDSALKALDKCSGLLLSGGPDIFPGRYGREEDTASCGPIDYYRDTLEHALLKAAQDKKMPVLGVCRGAQFINVFFGGTLIVDIPTETQSTVLHRCENYLECFHEIRTVDGTTLKSIVAESQGVVNTNHHQAVKDLAPNLRISAYGRDGVPEAIEWHDPLGKPFLLGVQWHPERMEPGHPFSATIARWFMDEVYTYRDLVQNEVNYERR